MAIKRSSSASFDDNDDHITHSSPDYNPSDDDAPKRKKTKTSSESPKGKTVIRKWTPQEDAIFIELAMQLLKTDMWKVIKEDGRLAYRGSPGITAHVKAMVKKMRGE
ncbi:hypothetical protein BD324DRAFT_651092 [Kockovaella imperatae]|uniref:Myb-like domain-containing protein n=1 Tax=Kockovaella imperatae TaxID=4999 RepID=A0A1Y1UEY1_9TREE|nr:hypothetical protein BD324DRAFT_651092 [Kockovaella imperatae]ORX36603.1 hypothetical protein BD324DRAFT_651092 [Kockovaella imperatae]